LLVKRSLTFNELKALLKHRREPERSRPQAGRSRLHRVHEIIRRAFAEDGISPGGSGAAALERYLNHMEALIRATPKAERKKI